MNDTQFIVAIIQARMNSKRLPGKVMADLSGKSVLEQMIRRVKRSKQIDQIVVATTANQKDDIIDSTLGRLGISVYRGDEEDVLGRFLAVANSESATAVVRLTGDCPLIDPEVVDRVVNAYKHGTFDYVSNCDDRTYPDGLDTEIFSYQSLVEADRYATDKFSREHVTPYMRGEKFCTIFGNFRRHQILFEADFSHIRWTLDTEEDLVRIRALYRELPDYFSWLQALSVATKTPKLLGIEKK